MRALVMSGGGAYGAFQAGVVATMKEGYDAFCGVSVGAINAVGLAQHSDWRLARETVIDLWKSINTKTIYKHHFPLGPVHGLWKRSLFNSKPLKEFLEKHLDLEALRKNGKLLRLGAVSMNTLKYELFDEQHPDLINAVLASSAFPMMFSLPEFNDQVWIDGGIRTMTPLKSAIDLGADDIDVILTANREQKVDLDPPKNVWQVGMRVIDTMLNEIFKTDLKCALLYNKLATCGNAPEGKRHVNIRIIEPPGTWEGDSLDFEQENIRKMLAVGTQVGVKLLGKL
jgi:NTE family protein